MYGWNQNSLIFDAGQQWRQKSLLFGSKSKVEISAQLDSVREKVVKHARNLGVG